jgi:hypothetical protein
MSESRKIVKVEIVMLVPENDENQEWIKELIVGNLDNETIILYKESEIKNANVIS